MLVGAMCASLGRPFLNHACLPTLDRLAQVQTFTVSVTAPAALDEYPEGTFQLGFDSTDLNTCKMCAVRADLTTAVIELDSTAASPASRAIRIGQNVEAALEALSNIGMNSHTHTKKASIIP